ncbi:AEC family transporter [Pseudomonas sp. NFACC05-1]|uniref:AEC family transporter n=1 Tax=Pseudomonas sp. NFACC05-1 TaxID=1566241 RepID=UPI00158794CE|nr:AEC family transporter [Pseudomonas sp. NFACC05-1]
MSFLLRVYVRLVTADWQGGLAMLMLSLNSTLSIFILILLGCLLSFAGLMRRGADEILSDYVFYVALPVEIFLTTLKSDYTPGVDINAYVQAYGLGVFILWVLIFIIYRIYLKKSLVEVGLNFIAIGQTNTAFLAVPVFILLLGDSALVVPIIIFQSVVLTSVAIFVMETSSFSKAGSSGAFLKRALLVVFKNPLIISALTGSLISQIKLSHMIDTGFFIIESMEMIADTAAPIALIALGASFYAGRVASTMKNDCNEIVLGVLIKNFLHPAISFVVGQYFFGLSGLLLFALILISAMPSPKNTFIFAQTYGVSVQKFNLILLATTGVSFFVVNVAGYFFLPDVV